MPCTNPVRVKGYTTKKGKEVKPHERNCPRNYKKANKTALANYDAMVKKKKKKKK